MDNGVLLAYSSGKRLSYDYLLSQIVETKFYPDESSTFDPFEIIKLLSLSALNKTNLFLSSGEVDSQDLALKPNQYYRASGLTIEMLVDQLVLESELWTLTLNTSGTTGLPKKIVHNFSKLIAGLKINSRKTNTFWALTYRANHIAGIQVILQGLVTISTIVDMYKSPPEEVIDNMITYGITHCSATPTFFRLLAKSERSVESMQRVTVGGESSYGELISTLKSIFPKARFLNIYASTEGGALLFSRSDTFEIPNEMQSEMKIVGNQLMIHQNLLSKSIRNEAIEEWYNTGDEVEFLDDRRKSFKFTGRSSSILKIGGYRVQPEEIERILLQRTDVSAAKVYGKKSSVLGTILCCQIVCQGVTEKIIKDFLKHKLPLYKIPRIIELVTSIEYNDNGKIIRRDD